MMLAICCLDARSGAEQRETDRQTDVVETGGREDVGEDMTAARREESGNTEGGGRWR